jgi:hypothetical protein
MWKRLKNFVQSVKRGNSEREKNASRNAEGSGALSDIKSDALTAEEEIMKILEDETLKEIDRSEVIYNVSNYLEFISCIFIANQLYQQKKNGGTIAKRVKYRGDGGSADGQIFLKKLKRVVINFDKDIMLLDTYTMAKKYRITLGKGLKLVIRGNDRALHGNNQFRGLYINSGNVVIERLSINECGSIKRTDGGGIYNKNGILKLKRVFFSECRAKNGVIYNAVHGQCLISASTCIQNGSQNNGGVFFNQGYLWIKDVLFKDNFAGENGGVCYNDAGASFEVDIALFERSKAQSGGALWNHRNSIVVYGLHKMYDNECALGSVFGHDSYQDGELHDEDVRRVVKNMEHNPEAGQIEISSMMNAHVKPNGLLYVAEALPMEKKQWPVWTNRDPNFLAYNTKLED